MHKTISHRIPILLVIATITVTGCSDSDRVARVATEAADRQAQQNTEMAQLNREVAEGTKRLVEADAEARQGITTMQHDVQTERTKVSEQRDRLETERQEIASQRRTESMLAPIFKICSIAAVGVAVIGFCWSLLCRLSHDYADETLGELLMEELVSESPAILPKASPVIERAALPADTRDSQQLPAPD
jgi:hypothetical protein